MKYTYILGLVLACHAPPQDAEQRLANAQAAIAALNTTELRVLLADVTHLQDVLRRTERARIAVLRQREEPRTPPSNPPTQHWLESAVQDLEVRQGLASEDPVDDGKICPRERTEVQCTGAPPAQVCRAEDGVWLVTAHQHGVLPLPLDGAEWSVLHLALPSLVVLRRAPPDAPASVHVLWLGEALFPLAAWPLDGAEVRVADLDADSQEDVVWRRGDDVQAVMQDGGARMGHVVTGQGLRDHCGLEVGMRVLGSVCR